ncbi:MAG: hypothetical protein KDD43_04050, partial [Bdellovibrionales bacterium]|nr:hypothetical protein [Bdellovibrionales bacterium]
RVSQVFLISLYFLLVHTGCADQDGFQAYQMNQEIPVEIREQEGSGGNQPVGGGQQPQEPVSPVTPPPTAPPPKPGDPIEEAIRDFDINRIKWLHTNVKDWALTSNLTHVDVSDRKVCLDHTKKGKWPTQTISGGVVVEGNPWVIVKFEGQWYAATYEWLRPGQVCKTMGASPPTTTIHDQFAGHIKAAPLNRWRPKRGEVVGFMVSALARMGAYKAHERTQIEFVLMP